MDSSRTDFTKEINVFGRTNLREVYVRQDAVAFRRILLRRFAIFRMRILVVFHIFVTIYIGVGEIINHFISRTRGPMTDPVSSQKKNTVV